MIIYGTRLFGKVDAVPGLGHVATRFFHIDYVPLIPVKSYLVLSNAGKGFRGIPIPFSGKSFLFAWLRAITVAVGVVGAILVLVALIGKSSDAWALVPGVITAVLGWGLFIFSLKHRTATRASYRRACELAKLVKLNQAGMDALAKAYGEPPISYGFQPIPIAPAAVEPELIEVIAVDGEEGEDTAATTDTPTEPASMTAQPIVPKRGY
jgi:hypothetical protein